MKSILVELEMLKSFALGAYIAYQFTKLKFQRAKCFEIKDLRGLK